MGERRRAAKRGLLILNLGTPDAPATPDVRRYLREFLSDPRVLDTNPALRAFLVNFMILPRRPRQSAQAYRSIWTERGSPLLFHGLDLVGRLGPLVGDDTRVELGMRYQKPSIASALSRLLAQRIDQIVVFPLFPQYSTAAWGSAVAEVFRVAGKLWNIPALQIVPPYYDHPDFIEAFAHVARPRLESFHPDRVLMSYHGLPERHLRKSDPTPAFCLKQDSCCDGITAENRFCYRAHCFQTSRALARSLRLPRDAWEVTFQSRLGRQPWIRPYTDLRLVELAEAGVRRIAVLCPSFTADCLETLEEIGIRGRESFLARGGTDLCLVPSLNSESVWARAIVRIVRDASPRSPGVESFAQSPEERREV